MDNSPQWGASEMDYPNHNGQEGQQRNDSNDPNQQVMQLDGYTPYPVVSMDGNYTELHASQQIVDQEQQPQPGPSGLSAFQVPTENGHYLSSGAESARETPDEGYSTASNDNYPSGFVKYEVQELKQEAEVCQNGAYVVDYQQPSTSYEAIQGEQAQLQSAPEDPNKNYKKLVEELQDKLIINGSALIIAADGSASPELKSMQIAEQNNLNGYNEPQPSTTELQPLRQQNAQQNVRKTPSKQRKLKSKEQSPSPFKDSSPEQEAASGTDCMRRSARPSVVEISEFKCTTCDIYFSRQCGLSQHKRWIHDDRKFHCLPCGKRFKTQESLNKHFPAHDLKEKPFQCPECIKQFFHKNDLRRHMNRHQATTPFACDICQKYFTRNDHLLAHRLARHQLTSVGQENQQPM